VEGRGSAEVKMSVEEVEPEVVAEEWAVTEGVMEDEGPA
jgi:hypothetical protein